MRLFHTSPPLSTVRTGRVIHPIDIVQHVKPLVNLWQASSPLYPLVNVTSINGPSEIPVGLMVSGGPDSMALAYLIKNLPLVSSFKLKPFGFIVEHGARQESREEANSVAERLRSIGIPPMILHLSWPAGTNPAKLSNFETQGRRKRYQAICEAAIARGIRHLFSGHHQDDQVESLLMRMVKEGRPSTISLRGIASSTTIPECDSIQGAHDTLKSFRYATYIQHKDNHTTADSTLELGPVGLSEPSSIHIHRPLLSFKKADLIATCSHFHIPSVNDPTNLDPTYTLRTAVRHLRSNYRLPNSLETTRILSLQSIAQRKLDKTAEEGIKILKSISITRLDLRVGNLSFSLPKDITRSNERAREAFAYALARLLCIVAPFGRSAPLQVPTDILEQLLPVQNADESAGSLKKFTDQETSADPRVVLQYRLLNIEQDSADKNKWHVTRQVMRKQDIAKNTISFAKSHDGISEWLEWDARYWVQSKCLTHPELLNEVTIRPLSATDMHNLRTTHTAPDHEAHLTNLRSLDGLLRSVAPGKLRYNMPVLAFRGHAFAFPTLDYKFPHVLNTLGAGISIEWNIRYKAIEHLSDLQLFTKSLNADDGEAEIPIEQFLQFAEDNSFQSIDTSG